MTRRQLVRSQSPYEEIIGFSRAVRVGDTVYISGTVAWGPDGELVGKADAYAQAAQAIRNIEAALGEAGASLKHVVRTRMYLTDMARWREVARAHAHAFADVRPAASMLAVKALADPEMLVEIEAVAVI